ncbi:MAG TPA: phosphoglucomutase/phosphomannomutase family protein [Deinococcales bacterium]|nr:phosphoglucomutase/phosphomannomutase family protein [Deinococcales bacterium]
MTIKFGTDGWRDVIADNFTFANVRQAAQAHAQYLKRAGGSSVVVGYDTRFLSDRFARAAAEVMAANGLTTHLTRTYVPTPALSHAVVALEAAGGVMITASHNPPAYNGYKIKGPYGGSATPAIVREVEAELERLQPTPSFDGARHAVIEHDPRPAYYGALSRLLDSNALAEYPGVLYHDAMGGAGAGWIDAYVKKAKLRAEVRPVHGVPNPTFYGVNPEPIPQNLESLRAVLAGEKRGVFGTATDGDADRVGAMLAGGTYFNSHQIFAVLLHHAVQRGKRGRVVKTFSTSQVIDLLAARHGLEVLETPIGFKYITDAFLEGEQDEARRVLIGGEESGGISVQGHIPERDGIANTLLLLEAAAGTGRGPGEIFREIERDLGVTHAYDRIDLHVDQGFDRAAFLAGLAQPGTIAGRKVREVQTKDGVKWLFEGFGWLLFRPSGTEPVVRIYSEAETNDEVRAILRQAAALAGA